MPYADRSTAWYDLTAEKAMHNCEERLRHLHPTAMAHYERLRADGTKPAEAMREAAFLFARPASAYNSRYVPRSALCPGSGHDRTWVAGPGTGTPETDPDNLALLDAQIRRGRQIVSAWDAQARERGSDPLGQAEQRLLLETTTNLPADVIDQVVQPVAGSGRHDLEPDRSIHETPRPGRDERPWVHDFPVPIEDVVAAAASATKAAGPAVAAAVVAKPPAPQVGRQP